jgi:hypothetical protein
MTEREKGRENKENEEEQRKMGGGGRGYAENGKRNEEAHDKKRIV